GKAKVLDANLYTAPVEDTHDRGLAVHRRQDADTQVEMLALDGHLDAAVLGPAFLGNVDRAHDFNTRKHRGQQTTRRTVAVDEHTVDPVADAHTVPERLDVDVAGTQADRFGNDEVDELDDGSITFLARRQPGRRLRLREIDGRIRKLLQHRVY